MHACRCMYVMYVMNVMYVCYGCDAHAHAHAHAHISQINHHLCHLLPIHLSLTTYHLSSTSHLELVGDRLVGAHVVGHVAILVRDLGERLRTPHLLLVVRPRLLSPVCLHCMCALHVCVACVHLHCMNGHIVCCVLCVVQMTRER